MDSRRTISPRFSRNGLRRIPHNGFIPILAERIRTESVGSGLGGSRLGRGDTHGFRSRADKADVPQHLSSKTPRLSTRAERRPTRQVRSIPIAIPTPAPIRRAPRYGTLLGKLQPVYGLTEAEPALRGRLTPVFAVSSEGAFRLDTVS